LFVVPAGVEHRPRALDEVHVLNLEASGTVNTGDAEAPGVLRAPEQLLPEAISPAQRCDMSFACTGRA
jgi:hypothetical protein